MTEAELQALAVVWQARLRLQDWDVRVRIVRGRDMPIEDSAAACSWQVRKRRAVISILDRADHDPSDEHWPQADHDPERSLVHELLHLHSAAFDDFEAGSAQDDALEQMIHTLSVVLVNMARQERTH